VSAARNARLVALGGAIAATLDILYALIFFGARGVAPERILQSIASGLLGPAAYRGGAASAVLGLLLHLLIAIAAAALFYAVARRRPWLREQWLAAGVIFGLVVYVVMNFVVVPLSAFPHRQTFAPAAIVGGLLVHALGVGVPIAFCVRAALGSPGRPAASGAG
jgi:hypothetical protein